jgi:hypothetical protein
VGNARFHYAAQPGWVDTIYLGTYRREVFDHVGTFHELVKIAPLNSSGAIPFAGFGFSERFFSNRSRGIQFAQSICRGDVDHPAVIPDNPHGKRVPIVPDPKLGPMRYSRNPMLSL